MSRGLAIDTPPERLWPWLVQMGKDRGGLYSYTSIENLFGFGIHNADRIVPELQHLAVGDRVPLSPRRFALIVRELAAPRTLVFEFADGGWIWTFHLTGTATRGTRLLVRNRWSSSTPDRGASSCSGHWNRRRS